MRTDGVVEKVEEWRRADQNARATKRKAKVKEEREVRILRRSPATVKGESRRRVTVRAATSQARQTKDEAIAAAQARGVKTIPTKSDIVHFCNTL